MQMPWRPSSQPQPLSFFAETSLLLLTKQTWVQSKRCLAQGSGRVWVIDSGPGAAQVHRPPARQGQIAHAPCSISWGTRQSSLREWGRLLGQNAGASGVTVPFRDTSCRSVYKYIKVFKIAWWELPVHHTSKMAKSISSTWFWGVCLHVSHRWMKCFRPAEAFNLMISIPFVKKQKWNVWVVVVLLFF